MEKYEEYTAKQYYFEIMRLSDGYSTWMMVYGGSYYLNPDDVKKLMKVHNYAINYALDTIFKNIHKEQMSKTEKKIAFSFCKYLKNKRENILSDYFRDEEDEILSEIEERIKGMKRFEIMAVSNIEYPVENEKFGWNN